MGIDGGTWDVLRPMIKEGQLPHISRLAENGRRGILTSTIPPETASAWTSFQTGVGPGKHGITAFFQYQPGEYKTSFINSRTIPLETIWQILSRHGKKVIVVNLPITFPPYEINGLMITGMPTPSVKANFTYPSELAEEVFRIQSDYTIVTTQDAFNRMTLEEFIAILISTEEKRTRVMLHLLEKYDWDVALIHFHSSDPLQHAVYWYLDKKSRFFDPEKYRLIQNFYRSLDNNIGRLLNVLGPDTWKIVLSDHGFCSVYKTININNFLCQKGFMVLRNKRFLNAQLLAVIALLKKWNKRSVRLRLSSKKSSSLWTKARMDRFVDWSRTKACMINGWLYGLIYLNCVGREKQGIVRFGPEYEAVRDSIKEALSGLTDPETGKRVIKETLKREEIYRGELLSNTPDLIAVPEEGYEFSRTFLERAGDFFTHNVIKRDHTGSHKRDGIFIFDGPMIDPDRAVGRANIEDILPTILYYFNQGIPDYMDGRVLAEIFRPGFREGKSLQSEHGAEKKPPQSDRQAYTEEENKQIEKTLRELGYIE
jgi:predicted AlkP superfamily phosphohydrolase/phosphomutase